MKSRLKLPGAGQFPHYFPAESSSSTRKPLLIGVRDKNILPEVSALDVGAIRERWGVYNRMRVNLNQMVTYTVQDAWSTFLDC